MSTPSPPPPPPKVKTSSKGATKHSSKKVAAAAAASSSSSKPSSAKQHPTTPAHAKQKVVKKKRPGSKPSAGQKSTSTTSSPGTTSSTSEPTTVVQVVSSGSGRSSLMSLVYSTSTTTTTTHRPTRRVKVVRRKKKPTTGEHHSARVAAAGLATSTTTTPDQAEGQRQQVANADAHSAFTAALKDAFASQQRAPATQAPGAQLEPTAGQPQPPSQISAPQQPQYILVPAHSKAHNSAPQTSPAKNNAAAPPPDLDLTGAPQYCCLTGGLGSSGLQPPVSAVSATTKRPPPPPPPPPPPRPQPSPPPPPPAPTPPRVPPSEPSSPPSAPLASVLNKPTAPELQQPPAIQYETSLETPVAATTLEPAGRKVINRADASGVVSARRAEDRGLVAPALSREVLEWLARGRVDKGLEWLGGQRELTQLRQEVMSVRQEGVSKQLELARRLSDSMQKDLSSAMLSSLRFDANERRQKASRRFQLPEGRY